MQKFEDLTGKQFTYLTVLSRDYNPKYKRAMWKCLCKCGNVKTVSAYNLKKGYTRSCGCKKYESHNVKHGMKHTRIYGIWTGINKRCFNPNSKGYKNYGGRGITMCDEWHKDFMSFYNWAISNGYQDNLTIERIDNNGNYCPQNCKWIVFEEQSRNRRNTIFIEYNGKRQTLVDWSKELNINPKTLYYRHSRGWSAEKMLTL